MLKNLNHVEIGGGTVKEENGVYHLSIPANATGYADAQSDDYSHLPGRRHFPHKAPISLELQAKFSHGEGELKGTAGFGFWNAPIGDARRRFPTYPQAVWFFYASEPNRLPFLKGQTGWFASVWGRPTLFPKNPRSIYDFAGIHCAKIGGSMMDWRSYLIEWDDDRCRLFVDEDFVLDVRATPFRPLGFVAWIDNQFMALSRIGIVHSGEQNLILVDKASRHRLKEKTKERKSGSHRLENFELDRFHN